MKKFYVRYEYSLGGPRYDNTIVILEAGEKSKYRNIQEKTKRLYESNILEFN